MHPRARSVRPTRRRGRRLLALVAVLTLVAGSCGDDDADRLSTSDVWARTSPAMADAGAIYMTVESDEGASIVGASVDESVAARVELHETTMADTDDMATEDGDHSGAMMMQQVEAIEVPAGGSVGLEPGGLHVMLLELAEPLEAGTSFDLTLILDDGEEHQVSVEVRDA